MVLRSHVDPEDVRAESAGSVPARAVWPEVVEVMREIGIGYETSLRLRILPDLGAVKLSALSRFPAMYAGLRRRELLALRS